jgi:hypothetical protein
MRLFVCQSCGQSLHFENTLCEKCGAALGFLPDALTLSALDPADASGARRARADGALRRPCANAAQEACNWMVPAEGGDAFCPSCALNRTVPDLSLSENLRRWRLIEAAKRRLVYAMRRLGPAMDPAAPGATPLAFDILDPGASAEPVLMGHADGLVTITLPEADDAAREKLRTELGEPYRTLLGHMRHESGHYYWLRLTAEPAALALARETFGDERADYAAALKRHYETGPPGDWRERFVSAYASAHPAEDFAETWAHYLHIVDTLDTAASFGLALAPETDPELGAEIRFDPYRAGFDRLMAAWPPLTVAVNSLNRSMGQPDLYPFVLAAPAVDKLRVVHRLIREHVAPAGAGTKLFRGG